MNIKDISKDLNSVKEDLNNIKDNVKEEIKGLDMGVLVTKATTAASKIDLDDVKHAVNELIDSPKTDKIKEVGRTVGDFAGYAKIVVGDAIKGLKK